MDIKNLLILSPQSVSFQALFPYKQKRQLCLLNLSEKDIVFTIGTPDNPIFEIVPTGGVIASYDTTELTILKQPSKDIVINTFITIKYMENPEGVKEHDNDKRYQPVDWTTALTASLKINLENHVEKDKEVLEQANDDYKPVCNSCVLDRFKRKVSWLRVPPRWPLWLGAGALSIGVYFGWEYIKVLTDQSASKIF